MARGGEIACMRAARNKVRLGSKGSDESDEDYMVGEDDEFDESEDDYCSSFDDEESEESLPEFSDEEVEDELVKNKSRRVQRSTGRKIAQGMKNNGVVKRRKKKEAYSEEEESYEVHDSTGDKQKSKSILVCKDRQEEDFVSENLRTQVSSSAQYVDSCNEKPRKKAEVSYLEENQDSDCAESENEDDKEFTPDEFDGVDDDEELPAIKKNKINRLGVRKTPIAKGRKRKRNVRSVKRTNTRKPIKKLVSTKKGRYHSEDFPDGHNHLKKQKITKKIWGSKQYRSNSDSDFVSTGSPDYDYTMSEEEREQVREARELCEGLATNLTSSSSVKKIKKEETVPTQRKHQGRKGKDKVADLKIEVAKQVCGICLSEEGKKTIRGVLNCCSHFFCFACIMEWSKVESRCPLCKQRFLTISRTAWADGGHGLRDAVITVPKRDQVYQPTEEELVAYLDPYESVLCTECHQGGDDALMLLCDLCDTPAHTYCVGIGHEVPEGNWYCDGCRPTVIASNGQATDQSPNRGANNNLPDGSSHVSSVRETFDLNELYVPESPATQATEHSPSTRNPTVDGQDASPVFGTGAYTLHERRRIHQQIHQILNSRARQLGRNDGVAPVQGVSLFGSQIYHDRVVAADRTVPIQPGDNIYSQGILPIYAAHQWYHRQIPSLPLNSLRGQSSHHQASASTGHSFYGLSHSDMSGTSLRIGQGFGHHHQFLPCNSRPNSGTDSSSLLYQLQEVALPSSTLQGPLHTPF